MKAVSLFSGVGGFEIGFDRAGIETVLQAERDPWCQQVLARHWPDVERVSDVADVRALPTSDIREVRDHGLPASLVRPAMAVAFPASAQANQAEYVSDAALIHGDGSGLVDGGAAGAPSAGGWRAEQLDLVYGGFPCQPFSVAGKRAGAADERDGWPEFRRVVSELRPRWVVAENVPGLLSIGGGRYFGSIVGDLDELGFDVAWAVLDARHFGIPQRRRRVFIVGGPRGRGAEQVLSLCESCCGNPETGRAPGQGAALAPALRASGVGVERVGDTRGQDPLVVASAVTASAGHHGHSSPRGDGSDNLIASTLRGRSHGAGVNMPGRGGEEAYGDNLVPALRARDSKGVGFDYEDGRLFPMAAGVRRLTPRECERLQGWPDDHTRWTADGREIADSHRYRMVGNGVASPCAEWIGRRLMEIAS